MSFDPLKSSFVHLETFVCSHDALRLQPLKAFRASAASVRGDAHFHRARPALPACRRLSLRSARAVEPSADAAAAATVSGGQEELGVSHCDSPSTNYHRFIDNEETKEAQLLTAAPWSMTVCRGERD